ncbi:MAG: adenylyltransferase/cytidyltransferase family protein [Candidatus Firestonebacteria bacterium]|nr:adenylyltransferase/cytidyltransferase family protein [Candidatus Firestonebacteria bacterium]
MNKLVERNKLSGILDEFKKHGKKIVLAAGCFDCLHVGHVRYLEEAKKFGDVLVVGINGDKAVRSMKGSGRPYVNQNERAEILSAFCFVDFVVIYEETTTKNLLLELKPDFYAKGTDYKADSVPWHDVVESYGGKVVIVGDIKTHSSTEIIEKMMER